MDTDGIVSAARKREVHSMKIHTSYNEAFHACMDSQKVALAHLKKLSKKINIDTSGCYKLFFLIGGGSKWFNINGHVFDTKPYELYVISENDWHYFLHFSEEDEHERYVFFIYPDYLRSLSSDATALDRCFQPGEEARHRIGLSENEKDRFLYMMTEFSASGSYGSDLMDWALFLEMLVLLNRMRREEPAPYPHGLIIPGNRKIENLLLYIDKHITENLSVLSLAEQFYFTPSYLCRFFRNYTGTTIHKYITAQRITIAKKFLAQGDSVTEVAYRCGFHDYNAFLRAFTGSVGVSPKKYAQSFK